VLAMTQEELAMMVGVSRQTTNQILNALQAQGALRIQRGGLELLDIDVLRALCD
jgi:CRP/FNR family transcriptional regulator, cyclic AMP receptor protein